MTTISQIERGFSAPIGPHGVSGTSGSTAPVTARNCNAIRVSSGVKCLDRRCSDGLLVSSRSIATVSTSAERASPATTSPPRR